MKVRVPFRWFGGKTWLADTIVSLMPPHNLYVEVFGGGAAVLLAKPPSPVEVYNDLDGGLVNFFRVLRDPERFEAFRRKAVMTPYSREDWENCKATWEDCTDDIERAYRWFVVANQSFSGNFGSSWSRAVSSSKRGMGGLNAFWLGVLERLPEIHRRVMAVQIEQLDFRDAIKGYDTAETLFYLDPPYLPETRKSGDYGVEMTKEDHGDLLNLLLEIKGMAILSGYKSELYKKLVDAGWQQREYQTVCHAAGKTRLTGILGEGATSEAQPRTEILWLSPNLRVLMPQISFDFKGGH